MGKSEPKGLLGLGIIPSAAGGSNVNPQVRKAAVEKLRELGLAVTMKTSILVVCRHVARMTGTAVPAVDGVNGYLGRWLVNQPERATPPKSAWNRAEYKPPREMLAAWDRARAAQPPIKAMVGNVSDPWRALA